MSQLQRDKRKKAFAISDKKYRKFYLLIMRKHGK